jgi:hypothetical protein
MKKFFSIILAVVLLASHMSLTIGTHMCRGEAIETRIIYGGSHLLGCGMEDMNEPCEIPLQHDDSFSKDQCCENHYQTFQTSDEFVNDSFQFSVSVDFALALVYAVLDINLSPQADRHLNTAYLPPPLEKDIQVLFQTFII